MGLKFKLGDQVHISKSCRNFQEGLSSLVDSGNFHCDQDYSKSSTSVLLQDYVDDEIQGVFYAEELQKVHKSDDIYKIEKILAEKKENGKVTRKHSTAGYLRE